MFKLLADGQWHPYEEIRDKIAAAVPPGRALRKYQERIERARRERNDPSYDTEANEDERIFYGQRGCAQIVITSWRGRGVQSRTDGAKKEIRMKPGFQAYGIEVSPGQQDGSQGQGVSEGPPDDSEPSELAHAGSVLDEVASVPPGAEPEQHDDPDPYYGYSGEPMTTPNVTVSDCESCPSCGLLVVDEAQHEQWHKGVESSNTPSDMALFAESEIRSLLGDVMGQLLDKFQEGFQAYLDQQFEEVSAALRASRRPTTRWSEGPHQRPNQ